MHLAPHPILQLSVVWRWPVLINPLRAGRDQEFMTKIKNGDNHTQRDVKNEGTSGDVYENK
jgi:hypothetical protein